MSLMHGKHIIIVGAGFGGLTAALKLAPKQILPRRGYEIILVDRHHHHLYTPALYEVAAIPRDYATDQHLISSTLIATSEIIRGRSIRFLCDEFVKADIRARTVTLAKYGVLGYEFLVLALGAQTNYFNIPGLKEHSFPLKTADDAVSLRNQIETLLAARPSLKIIVAGAGPSGVELMAEFVNFICILQGKLTPAPICNVKFILVEASPAILPGFPQSAVRRAGERLRRLGIEIKTNAVIIAASPDAITYKSGERETYDVLIWSGGVRGPSILSNLGLPLSPKGTLIVDRTLRVRGADGRAFAVGDNAWFVNPRTQKPLAWTVPVAEAEGRHVAREIVRAISGKPRLSFKPLLRYPFILAVGKKYALTDLIVVHLKGMLGWCAKQLVELRYLLFLLPWPRAFVLWWKNMRLYSSNDS